MSDRNQDHEPDLKELRDAVHDALDRSWDIPPVKTLDDDGILVQHSKTGRQFVVRVQATDR